MAHDASSAASPWFPQWYKYLQVWQIWTARYGSVTLTQFLSLCFLLDWYLWNDGGKRMSGAIVCLSSPLFSPQLISYGSSLMEKQRLNAWKSNKIPDSFKHILCFNMLEFDPLDSYLCNFRVSEAFERLSAPKPSSEASARRLSNHPQGKTLGKG